MVPWHCSEEANAKLLSSSLLVNYYLSFVSSYLPPYHTNCFTVEIAKAGEVAVAIDNVYFDLFAFCVVQSVMYDVCGGSIKSLFFSFHFVLFVVAQSKVASSSKGMLRLSLSSRLCLWVILDC